MQNKFKALSSEPRLKLIKSLLEENEYRCICKLEEVINKDRSVTYRHFKKLERAGLVKTRKQGKRVECKLKKPKKIRKLLKIMEDL